MSVQTTWRDTGLETPVHPIYQFVSACEKPPYPLIDFGRLYWAYWYHFKGKLNWIAVNRSECFGS